MESERGIRLVLGALLVALVLGFATACTSSKPKTNAADRMVSLFGALMTMPGTNSTNAFFSGPAPTNTAQFEQMMVTIFMPVRVLPVVHQFVKATGRSPTNGLELEAFVMNSRPSGTNMLPSSPFENVFGPKYSDREVLRALTFEPGENGGLRVGWPIDATGTNRRWFTFTASTNSHKPSTLSP